MDVFRTLAQTNLLSVNIVLYSAQRFRHRLDDNTKVKSWILLLLSLTYKSASVLWICIKCDIKLRTSLEDQSIQVIVAVHILVSEFLYIFLISINNFHINSSIARL